MIITLLRDKFYRNDQPDQYRTALLLEFLPSQHCGDKCVPGWPLLPRHEACLNKRVLHPKRNPGRPNHNYDMNTVSFIEDNYR